MSSPFQSYLAQGTPAMTAAWPQAASRCAATTWVRRVGALGPALSGLPTKLRDPVRSSLCCWCCWPPVGSIEPSMFSLHCQVCSLYTLAGGLAWFRIGGNGAYNDMSMPTAHLSWLEKQRCF